MAAAKAHVFVNDLSAPMLDEGDRHHLERVLRLRPGDEITVSDGAGGHRQAVLLAGGELEPAGDPALDERPSPTVAIAFAPAKGDRTDWAVQKLTELGADVIVPMITSRSVVRWEGDAADRHVERLRRIAREAASQSRRTWLPVVEDVAPFAEVAARAGALMADREGDPLPEELPAEAVVVLVGPEGGWSDEELARGLPRVALGPHVLRTETAAVAAATLLSAKGSILA